LSRQKITPETERLCFRGDFGFFGEILHLLEGGAVIDCPVPDRPDFLCVCLPKCPDEGSRVLSPS